MLCLHMSKDFAARLQVQLRVRETMARWSSRCIAEARRKERHDQGIPTAVGKRLGQGVGSGGPAAWACARRARRGLRVGCCWSSGLLEVRRGLVRISPETRGEGAPVKVVLLRLL